MSNPKDKSTKVCELTVCLQSGGRIVGKFHVPMGTSTAIRPSDAILEKSSSFLVLSDARVYESNLQRLESTVIIPMYAVSHIELPSGGWTTKPEGDSAGIHQKPAAPVPSILRSQTTTPQA